MIPGFTPVSITALKLCVIEYKNVSSARSGPFSQICSHLLVQKKTNIVEKLLSEVSCFVALEVQEHTAVDKPYSNTLTVFLNATVRAKQFCMHTFGGTL